jgi:hypothetical protein
MDSMEIKNNDIPEPPFTLISTKITTADER